MLPFGRMISYGNILQPIDKTYELNLDFSQQVIGDQTIRDYSYRNRLFTKLNSLSAQIQYDSTLQSNVMFFNGGVFSTAMADGLRLQGKNFELDVMFKRYGTSGYQVLYCTGYYPDTANNKPGIAHQIGQYLGYDQYFVQKDPANFSRHLIQGLSNVDWQRLVYRRDSTGVTITRYKNGSLANQIQYPNLDFADGDAFSVGGFYQTPGQWNFYGYMQYLKLKLL